MGLADKLADIIRPRPAGLFSGLAPAATPKDILARLNTEMVKVIQSPEFRKRMEDRKSVV